MWSDFWILAYYLIVSMAHESKCGLGGSSAQDATRLQSKSHLELRFLFQVHSHCW